LFISHISVRSHYLPVASRSSSSIEFDEALPPSAQWVREFTVTASVEPRTSDRPDDHFSAATFSPARHTLILTCRPRLPRSSFIDIKSTRIPSCDSIIAPQSAEDLTYCNHGVTYHPPFNRPAGQSFHLSRVSVVSWWRWRLDTALL